MFQRIRAGESSREFNADPKLEEWKRRGFKVHRRAQAAKWEPVRTRQLTLATRENVNPDLS